LVEEIMKLIAVLQTDCPTCQLIVPYLNRLAAGGVPLTGISQDAAGDTADFVRRMEVAFPLEIDPGYRRSVSLGVSIVPALVVLDDAERAVRSEPGFAKTVLNEIAAMFGLPEVAGAYDGAPSSKPGCSSRHLEMAVNDEAAPALDIHSPRGSAASELTVPDTGDPYEFCFAQFGDALPVIPPTRDRVNRMLEAAGLDPLEVIARVPPCFGPATTEKIAANAVMAGCVPGMMRVLVPLTRAICDERFNAHGVQATTHFAAPLTIVNGPVRKELGFQTGQNAFSNVHRANSTLGRAIQLILLNLGGARPDSIDMSTLGSPAKFSYCVAENEEESPWEPLHVELGFRPGQSTVTLFAGEAPHGVSEHNARTARGVLKTISYSLATVWTYRLCVMPEAFVVLSPEHVRTIHRDGWSKSDVRQFLFENTAVPVRCFDAAEGDGVQLQSSYRRITVDGEPGYQKFRTPEQIKIVVAGGRAGKFSAIIGGWQSGPRGSQMVTYPIADRS
jgi:hypothetical protein